MFHRMEFATTLAEALLAEANVAFREADGAGAIAILDAGGHLLQFTRGSDVGFAYVDLAIAKAWSAVALGRGPTETGERLSAYPGVMAAIVGATHRAMLPMRGGLLLKSNAGTIVGAIGIAGPSGGDVDAAVASAAAQAVGLVGEA